MDLTTSNSQNVKLAIKKYGFPQHLLVTTLASSEYQLQNHS